MITFVSMFERTRTYNLLIRSQTLYPIELQTLCCLKHYFLKLMILTWDRRIRTFDTLYQKQVPYHLAISHIGLNEIIWFLSGGRFELPTRRFSVSYSNQLSYPDVKNMFLKKKIGRILYSKTLIYLGAII